MKEFWSYNRNDLTLWLTVHPHYEVCLGRCNTPAEVLDWIAQVAGKNWATDEIVGALVRKLDDVLYLQKNLCPSGQSKTINARLLLRPDPLKQGLMLKQKIERVARGCFRKNRLDGVGGPQSRSR